MTGPVLNPTADHLLAHLHRGGRYAYWWAVAGQKKTSIWWQPGRPAPLPNSQHNVYFGVHPSSVIPSTNARGEPAPSTAVRSQAATIAAVNCLYAEFDAKHFDGGKAAALAHIEQLAPAPSVIVDSGGGYHCYWLLHEPFILATDADRARADRVQKGWVKHVGGDEGAKDLARPLRVPGTRNFKPEYAPDFPEVSFVQADFQRLYTLDALEAGLPAPQPLPAPEPLQPLTSASSDADHARRYALAALEGERQAMLAAGDGERHNTRLAAAYKLAGYIPHISEDEITAELAVNFGPNEANARKTIADGIAAGRAAPRTIPGKPQPAFDAEGHACCPTHQKRLVACFSGNGWRCPVIGASLCFWWQGEGYTPPVETTIDDLDTLDADELRRRLQAVTAERDRWKQRAERLDEWRAWTETILSRDGLKPTEKGILVGMYPIIDAKRSLAHAIGNGDRIPLNYEHVADVLKTSKTTIGRVVEVAEKAGLWRRDPEMLASPAGYDVPHMRLELQQAYDDPKLVQVVDRPQHGGARPGAGRKPKCSSCPPGTHVRKITKREESYYCVGCGELILEQRLPDIIQTYDPDGEIQDETGEEQQLFSLSPVGVAAPATPATTAEIQDETGTQPVCDGEHYVEGETWRAIWHGPDTDTEVTIVGDYGVGPDGLRYLRSAESASGLPAGHVELLELLKPVPPPAHTTYNPDYRHSSPASPFVIIDPMDLPGVRSGQIAPDDPWILEQLRRQAQAAPPGGAS